MLWKIFYFLNEQLFRSCCIIKAIFEIGAVRNKEQYRFVEVYQQMSKNLQNIFTMDFTNVAQGDFSAKISVNYIKRVNTAQEVCADRKSYFDNQRGHIRRYVQFLARDMMIINFVEAEQLAQFIDSTYAQYQKEYQDLKKYQSFINYLEQHTHQLQDTSLGNFRRSFEVLQLAHADLMGKLRVMLASRGDSQVAEARGEIERDPLESIEKSAASKVQHTSNI